MGVGTGVGIPVNTGAAVGTTSPVQPQVPTAKDCARAHCSNVSIRVRPASFATPQETVTPPSVANVAS